MSDPRRWAGCLEVAWCVLMASWMLGCSPRTVAACAKQNPAGSEGGFCGSCEQARLLQGLSVPSGDTRAYVVSLAASCVFRMPDRPCLLLTACIHVVAAGCSADSIHAGAAAACVVNLEVGELLLPHTVHLHVCCCRFWRCCCCCCMFAACCSGSLCMIWVPPVGMYSCCCIGVSLSPGLLPSHDPLCTIRLASPTTHVSLALLLSFRSRARVVSLRLLCLPGGTQASACLWVVLQHTSYSKLRPQQTGIVCHCSQVFVYGSVLADQAATQPARHVGTVSSWCGVQQGLFLLLGFLECRLSTALMP